VLQLVCNAHVQAADALRLVGVGRNEYIAILNACKNRRVMWRVNRWVGVEQKSGCYVAEGVIIWVSINWYY